MPMLITAVKEAGLLLVSSGKLNCVPGNVALQEEKGVDAIIVNRLFKYNGNL
jgi:hypothetical protein